MRIKANTKLSLVNVTFPIHPTDCIEKTYTFDSGGDFKYASLGVTNVYAY